MLGSSELDKLKAAFEETEALNKKAALVKKAGKAVKAGNKAKITTAVKAKATKAVAKGAKKALKAGAKSKAAKDLAKKANKKKGLEVEDIDNDAIITVVKKVKGKGKGLKKKKEDKDTEKVTVAKKKSQDKDKDKDFEIPPGNAPFFGQPGASSSDFQPKVYLSLEATGYISSLDQVDAAHKAMQAPQVSTSESSQEPGQKADEQLEAPLPPPSPASEVQAITQTVEVAIEKVRDEKRVKGHHLDPSAMVSSLRQSSSQIGASDIGPSSTPINPSIEAAKKAKEASQVPSMDEIIRMHAKDSSNNQN